MSSSAVSPLAVVEPASRSPEHPTLRVVRWLDPIADPHGVHPCSRYVELYWLGIIGPSTIARGPEGDRWTTTPLATAPR